MKTKLKNYFNKITNKDFLISISCLMLIQTILFFGLKPFQHNYHIIVASIDNKIPLLPHFVYIYNLFYPFIFLVFYHVYCRDNKNYYKGIAGGIVGYVIAHSIFFTYPTLMLRPEIPINLDWLTYNFLKLTYTMDTPALDSLPSIHCLFCFQAAYTAITSKNIIIQKKFIILMISLLISISTVLVKQHYFYDIIGALIVFIIANTIVELFNKKHKKG